VSLIVPSGYPVDVDWTPPKLLSRDEHTRVRGALAGSLLYEQPEHVLTRDRVREFLSTDAPTALEIGFDHGMRLLDHARRWPEVRWLGVEIRRARVEAALPHAPANCLLLRADARTLLSAVVPPASLGWVYILFPTPTEHPRHLLLTPGLVSDLARALAPGGSVLLRTDVEGYARWADTCFEGWSTPAEAPPMGPVLSRRERVCKRDGLVVHQRCWQAPVHPTATDAAR
jgi:tRNA G46 methylase TrmB